MSTPIPKMGLNTTQRRWVEWGTIFGFWMLMALFTAVHRVLDPRFEAYRENAAWAVVIARPVLTFLAWALITPLIFWIARRLPLERATQWKRILQHFIIAIFIATMVDVYDDFMRVFLLGDLVNRTFDPLRELLRLGFLNELTIYFAVMAGGFARDYFIRYRERQEEAVQLRAQAAQLQTQLAEAKLETLRMQVNPHFLFNTLHAVTTLVGRDPKGVRRMIARLSSLLRYTLEGSSAQEVPLHQEMGFLDGYLEIQEIRFQGHLKVEKHIDRDTHDALVPNLILQPLVENAIMHGTNHVDGKGHIVIEAFREQNTLVLRVRDNGPGLQGYGSGDGAPVRTPGSGVGLENTQERLKALYGTAQAMTLTNNPDAGVTAEIRLPFHTSSDLRTSVVTA